MEKLLSDIISRSDRDTMSAGAGLFSLLRDNPALPRFVALDGDLGTGKTEFVRGFASLASPGSAVRSPTYTLVNEYLNGEIPVYHFDVYRINGEDDLYSTGFYDYPGRGFCLVEWCERIPYAIPDGYISVKIEKIPPDMESRHITISLITDNITGII